MEYTEMIPGEIYFFQTAYKWLVRFSHIIEDTIIGHGCIQIGQLQDYYDGTYGNDIKAHKEIRPATADEIALYESKEETKPKIEIPQYLITN